MTASAIIAAVLAFGTNPLATFFVEYNVVSKSYETVSPLTTMMRFCRGSLGSLHPRRNRKSTMSDIHAMLFNAILISVSSPF